jgi:hypothetical protein
MLGGKNILMNCGVLMMNVDFFGVSLPKDLELTCNVCKCDIKKLYMNICDCVYMSKEHIVYCYECYINE